MRRVFVVGLLALSIVLLSGGALSWLHDRAHRLEDARPGGLRVATGDARDASPNPDGGPARPKHDESNCFLHAQLAAFVTAVPGVVPLLVSLGLLVAFVTMLPRLVVSARCAVFLDCRGPPAV